MLKKKSIRRIVVAAGLVVAFGLGAGAVILRDVVHENAIHHQVALPHRAEGLTITWLPSSVTRFTSTIEASAARYNVDANLVAILMTLESGGYTRADSGYAQGLMQVTPLTAKDIASKHIRRPVKKYDLFDSGTSIEFGVAYIAWLRDNLCDYRGGPTWDECVEAVAAGYNGGLGVAQKLRGGGGVADVQTVIYSRNAFNMWRERNAKTSPTYQRWLEAGGQTLVDKANEEMK